MLIKFGCLCASVSTENFTAELQWNLRSWLPFSFQQTKTEFGFGRSTIVSKSKTNALTFFAM